MTNNNKPIQSIIPTIDLKDPKDQNAKLLHETCKEIGFFYVINHNISKTFLSRVFQETKYLFNLPLSEKQKLTDPVLNRGYTAFEEETLDPSVQKDRGDTKEGYYICNEISRDDPNYDVAKLRGPNVWPEERLEFRSIMMEYMTQISNLGLKVVELLALSLGLHQDYFLQFYQDIPLQCLRLLHYSREYSNISNGVFGCGAHSDYGMITLLLTDHHKGLQVYSRSIEEWIDVEPKEGHFIVNLGDMLERWTNGLYRSTLHRVIIAKSEVDSNHDDGDRYSIPFFFDPSFDTIVECLDTCIQEGREKKYEKITVGEHLLNKYQETHADFTPV